jgi:hypothetical protein
MAARRAQAHRAAVIRVVVCPAAVCRVAVCRVAVCRVMACRAVACLAAVCRAVACPAAAARPAVVYPAVVFRVVVFRVVAACPAVACPAAAVSWAIARRPCSADFGFDSDFYFGCLDFALHQIPIELAICIVGAQLQRGLVGFHRIVPLLQSFLGRRLFGLLAGAIQRVTQVVVGILLYGEALRPARRRVVDGLLKRLGGLRKLASTIRCGSGVVVQYRLFRIKRRCRIRSRRTLRIRAGRDSQTQPAQDGRMSNEGASCTAAAARAD